MLISVSELLVASCAILLFKIPYLQVKVNGELVQTGAQEYHYFVLNKPSGYVCTSNKDAPEAKGKHIVLDLFQEWMIKWQKRQSKVSCSCDNRLFAKWSPCSCSELN